MSRFPIMIAILALMLGAAVLTLGRDILNKARAKETVTNMRRVVSLLQLERPAVVDVQYLRNMLAKHDVSPSYLLDGWNRPLVVEVLTDEDGVQIYLALARRVNEAMKDHTYGRFDISRRFGSTAKSPTKNDGH